MSEFPVMRAEIPCYLRVDLERDGQDAATNTLEPFGFMHEQAPPGAAVRPEESIETPNNRENQRETGSVQTASRTTLLL
jgi:hypothetical protein